MTADPTELAVNRENTRAFIAAHPLTLALIPTIRVKSGTGGIQLASGSPRVAQVLRLIEAPSAYGNSPGLIEAADGRQRRVTYQLLGEYTATIEVGDYWLDANGVRYEVVELLPYNDYERRGQVVFYG